jgi:hypothetical protein
MADEMPGVVLVVGQYEEVGFCAARRRDDAPSTNLVDVGPQKETKFCD